MFENFNFAKFDVLLKTGEEGLYLPPYKGSTLRGGFGSVFKRIACAQRGSECQTCMLRSTCPYTNIFAEDSLVALSIPVVVEQKLEVLAI